MTRFVCPECEAEISEDDTDKLTGMALDHMEQEHGKENFSASYARENIMSNS